ncbi:MAG: AzlD domain-containing protein [Clostridiales bacterium]|nr:AzlD domain-containing protein [Clostridiales bacterium]
MQNNIIIYILVMALVTYLTRMIPMALVKGKIESRFVKSFIYYVPYAVLSAMTIPAIFYSTADTLSAVVGFIAAIVVAFFGRSLLTVALSACGSVLICELVMKYLII